MRDILYILNIFCSIFNRCSVKLFLNVFGVWSLFQIHFEQKLTPCEWKRLPFHVQKCVDIECWLVLMIGKISIIWNGMEWKCFHQMALYNNLQGQFSENHLKNSFWKFVKNIEFVYYWIIYLFKSNYFVTSNKLIYSFTVVC